MEKWHIKYLKVGGKVVSMKAADAREEINDAKKAIEVLGGAIEKIDEFNLPQTDIGRTIITIRKQKQTPNKYPRKPGTPSKEPIK